MNTCRQQGHEVKRTAIRVPVAPSRIIEEESACQQFACPNRLVPFLEEAIYPEDLLRSVFRDRGQLGPDRDWYDERAAETAQHARRIATNLEAARTNDVMAEVRDAKRPAVGQVTSDPDEFLCRAIRVQPHTPNNLYNGAKPHRDFPTNGSTATTRDTIPCPRRCGMQMGTTKVDEAWHFHHECTAPETLYGPDTRSYE